MAFLIVFALVFGLTYGGILLAFRTVLIIVAGIDYLRTPPAARRAAFPHGFWQCVLWDR